jgi:hypothetical protein
MSRALRFSAVLLPAIFLTACDEIDFGDHWDRYKEDFHYSYDLPPGGRLSVENVNGPVEISTWERNTVEINGTKHANSQQGLRDTKIDVVPSTNSVSVRTIPPSGWRHGVGARYSIRVPRRVDLDRIVSSNGSIRIEDIEGRANLKTSNGSVRCARSKGELDVVTSNGGIDVQHTGSARLHTSNGSIRAEVDKGAFEATTSNSSITARLTDPDQAQPIRAESSNGHIDLTTNSVREVRAGTSNSSITLRVPSNTNARLRAHTSNSSITTDFDVTVHGHVSKNSMDGNIGSGGPVLDLSTSNGSIKVLKY